MLAGEAKPSGKGCNREPLVDQVTTDGERALLIHGRNNRPITAEASWGFGHSGSDGFQRGTSHASAQPPGGAGALRRQALRGTRGAPRRSPLLD